MAKSLTLTELLKLSEKQWLTTTEIQKIGCVGRNRAYEIRDKIRSQMLEKGDFVPRYVVGTDYVLQYFNIDEKKLRKKVLENGGAING